MTYDKPAWVEMDVSEEAKELIDFRLPPECQSDIKDLADWREINGLNASSNF